MGDEAWDGGPSITTRSLLMEAGSGSAPGGPERAGYVLHYAVAGPILSLGPRSADRDYSYPQYLDSLSKFLRINYRPRIQSRCKAGGFGFLGGDSNRLPVPSVAAAFPTGNEEYVLEALYSPIKRRGSVRKNGGFPRRRRFRGDEVLSGNRVSTGEPRLGCPWASVVPVVPPSDRVTLRCAVAQASRSFFEKRGQWSGLAIIAALLAST
ncbi:hypothetical protein B0H14DRAFT_3124295 [Mycena olivaceomarginata]|nr:hypothetical protein B0H14DRAFT_3124295 [Mycena olivaceomarginata]